MDSADRFFAHMEKCGVPNYSLKAWKQARKFIERYATSRRNKKKISPIVYKMFLVKERGKHG